MIREFHWKNAVCYRGENYLSVRFRASESDHLRLQWEGVDVTESYEPDANVLLVVQGPKGLPDLPKFECGEPLYDGPAIEIVFLGVCDAKLDEEGLHVYVKDGELLVVRSQGLKFSVEELQSAVRFDVMNDGAVEDPPPHGPPPPQNTP